METIIEAFRQNLQLAYRKAQDSDVILDDFAKKGMANFSAIFTQDEGFTSQSNRLLPYVEEVAKRFLDVTGNGVNEEVSKADLATLAQLLEKIFSIQVQLEQAAAIEENKKVSEK